VEEVKPGTHGGASRSLFGFGSGVPARECETAGPTRPPRQPNHARYLQLVPTVKQRSSCPTRSPPPRPICTSRFTAPLISPSPSHRTIDSPEFSKSGGARQQAIIVRCCSSISIVSRVSTRTANEEAVDRDAGVAAAADGRALGAPRTACASSRRSKIFIRVCHKKIQHIL
jgi:hypothetical protein